MLVFNCRFFLFFFYNVRRILLENIHGEEYLATCENFLSFHFSAIRNYNQRLHSHGNVTVFLHGNANLINPFLRTPLLASRDLIQSPRKYVSIDRFIAAR